MKRSKRYFISLMLLIAVLCGFFSISKNRDLKVYAISNVFSVEEYTNDDYLLKPNGQSSEKNIREFSTEVKAGKSTYYPELAEVIPRQYLESQEKNATFAYNGKEYGFYVVKNEERFDVLLIDFMYEFDKNDEIHNSDVEFRIKIKPLLQQSFSRSTDKTGAYTWAKTTTTNKYYVSNPAWKLKIVKFSSGIFCQQNR